MNPLDKLSDWWKAKQKARNEELEFERALLEIENKERREILRAKKAEIMYERLERLKTSEPVTLGSKLNKLMSAVQGTTQNNTGNTQNVPEKTVDHAQRVNNIWGTGVQSPDLKAFQPDKQSRQSNGPDLSMFGNGNMNTKQPDMGNVTKSSCYYAPNFSAFQNTETKKTRTAQKKNKNANKPFDPYKDKRFNI